MHKGAPKVEVNLPVYPTEVHQVMQDAGRCIGKYVKTQYIRCYEAQKSHVGQAIKSGVCHASTLSVGDAFCETQTSTPGQ